MAKTKEITFTCGEFRAVPQRYDIVTIYIKDPDTDELLAEIDNADMILHVSNNFEVDAVFSKEELDKWAIDNGYTKE